MWGTGGLQLVSSVCVLFPSNLLSVLRPQRETVAEGGASLLGLVGDQVGRPDWGLIVELIDHTQRTLGFSLGVSEFPECVYDVIIVRFFRRLLQSGCPMFLLV